MPDKPSREPARDPQDLERLLVSRQHAGDVEGMVALFESDAVIDSSDGRLTRGRAAIEAFFAGVVEAFRAAGRFLDRRQPEVTAGLRTAGLSLRLLVEVRMDQDQMELEFPPELLAACGRHGLGVYVISNDIAAS